MESRPENRGDEVVRPQVVSQGPVPASGVPQPPAAVPQVQKIVLEQPGGLFGRFGKLLWIALLVSLFINFSQRASYESYFTRDPQLTEKFHSGDKYASDKVAVLRIEGAIIKADGFIKRQIDRILKDEDVKAVVLRINSPGGTVTASDYLLHHLEKMREERDIPVVVSMGSLCASGGYYLAMATGDQEQAIYAEPTTWTGSIGVVIPHYDVSELLAKWDVKDDSIASHKFKQLGSPTRKLSQEDRAEEREILQSLVDESFAGFKDVVRRGRPMFRENDAALDEVATGQVFTARQAQQAKLVDEIGFVDDAIERAIELAGLSGLEVRVIRYTRHVPGLLETLSGTQSRTGGLDLESLLDLTAPRAWYLSTWVPSVLGSGRER